MAGYRPNNNTRRDMAVERRQNAAMKTFVKLISLTAVLLCSFVQVFAEGSVNYCTSGNRLFLDSGSHVYAYVKEGDVVHIGTSSYSKDKDLSITFPDGTKKDIDLDPGSNSEGLILNHTEEMRGPSPVSHGGYVPLSFRVDSSGYMDIVFYGSDLNVTFLQAIAASLGNIAVEVVIGIPILFILAKRYKSRSNLEEDE